MNVRALDAIHVACWDQPAIGVGLSLVEVMPNILPVEDTDSSKEVERAFKGYIEDLKRKAYLEVRL